MSGSRGDASGSIPQASFQVLTNSPPEVHQVTSTSVQSSYRLRLATQSISFLRHRFIGNGKHVHFLCRSRTVIACLPLDVETTSLLRTRCFVLRRLSEEQKKRQSSTRDIDDVAFARRGFSHAASIPATLDADVQVPTPKSRHYQSLRLSLTIGVVPAYGHGPVALRDSKTRL